MVLGVAGFTAWEVGGGGDLGLEVRDSSLALQSFRFQGLGV